VLFDKIVSCILFEKYIYILALEIANHGKQHCANCIGTLLFPNGKKAYAKFKISDPTVFVMSGQR